MSPGLSHRRRTNTHRVLTAALGAGALLAALAGCGDDSGSAEDPPSSTPATTTEPETTEPETTEPETTEPETTEPETTGLTGALVPAAQLPGLNAATGWRQRHTTARESDPPAWVCQQASLLANGAVATRQRAYTATAGGATATQVVARTADARSAKRVVGALLGNARECAQELADRGRKPNGRVQPLAGIDVPVGRAAWGVVFSGPVPGSPDESYIDAVVVARVGMVVSVLSMSSVGQDYNYEAGQTPPEQAAPIVVARMAAAR